MYRYVILLLGLMLCAEIAGAHQFGQISVERMVREPCQFHMLCRPVGAASECDAENFRCRYCIVRECFVEVAHAKKEYCIGMFLFHLDILFHQRSFYDSLCHGYRFLMVSGADFSLKNRIVKLQKLPLSPKFYL